MLVYQHIATFDSLAKAQDWIPTMYPGQLWPDSWLGMYKEQGSTVAALDFKDQTASLFAYTSAEPYFELTGKVQVVVRRGVYVDILTGRNYETGEVYHYVVRYRGFATQVGDNQFRVF